MVSAWFIFSCLGNNVLCYSVLIAYHSSKVLFPAWGNTQYSQYEVVAIIRPIHWGVEGA